MLRKSLQKITTNEASDKSYVPYVPIPDQAYILKKTFVTDLKKLTTALIIPGATDIRYESKDGWERILFNYDNASFYIAFKRVFDELQQFKTNCSPYLLQDVLHSLFELPQNSSLANNILNKIIESLNSTPYAIRELGEEDKKYRREQRHIATLANGNMSDSRLLEARQKYREIPYVRVQMALTQLVLKKLSDDDLYNFGAANYEYLQSFPLEQQKDASDTITSRLDINDDLGGSRAVKEYIKRVFDTLGFISDAKFLDVGFGYGKNIILLANQFNRLELYGIEPEASLFEAFSFMLNKTKQGNLKKDHFYQETVQTFAKRKEHLGSFDIISVSLIDIPTNSKDSAFEAIALLCKPDGKVMITCLNTEYADPNNKCDRNSLLPTLFKHFGEVSRGQYSEEYTMHRFVFLCEKPKRAYVPSLIPHVDVHGFVQQYLITDWDAKKEQLTLNLGGSYKFCDREKKSAYILLSSNLLTKEHRKTFGLHRVRIRMNDKEDVGRQIYLLKQFYSQVTVEEDLEQKNCYMLTYPKSLHLKLQEFFKKDPAKVEGGVVKMQAFMRGFIQRQKIGPCLVTLAELSKKSQEALNKKDYGACKQFAKKAKHVVEEFCSSYQRLKK